MSACTGSCLTRVMALLLTVALLPRGVTYACIDVALTRWERLTSMNDVAVVQGAMTSYATRSKLACITSCSQLPSCQAVCWLPGSPGTCYLHSTVASSPTGLEASHPGAVYFAMENAVPSGLSSCKAYYQAGHVTSGVYSVTVTVQGVTHVIQVYCDMDTDGGGWTVFQKRFDGSVTFYGKLWAECAAGFGSPSGEFWLGLDNIHLLTASGMTTARVDLGDWSGNTAYAKYSSFTVDSSATDYTLTVSGYSGSAGDSLTIHNGKKFSTEDGDHDTSSSNCALDWGGPWWHAGCGNAKLNGIYYSSGPNQPSYKGVVWLGWLGQTYSLKTTSVKLREP